MEHPNPIGCHAFDHFEPLGSNTGREGKLMKRNVRSSVVAGALCLGVSGVTAFAAPVDNPGFFFWNGNDGNILLDGGNQGGQIGSSGGLWDTDIDGAGVITTNAMSIAPITVSGYTVQVLVNAGSTSGTLDASTGALSLTMSLRVRITGNNVGSNCVTSSFTGSTIAIAGSPTGYSYDPISDVGSAVLYTDWMSVPAMTNCNGQEATINSLFDFGPGGQGLLLGRVGYEVSGGPFGS